MVYKDPTKTRDHMRKWRAANPERAKAQSRKDAARARERKQAWRKNKGHPASQQDGPLDGL
jgi:hypothetical protein